MAANRATYTTLNLSAIPKQRVVPSPSAVRDQSVVPKTDAIPNQVVILSEAKDLSIQSNHQRALGTRLSRQITEKRNQSEY